MSPLYFPLDLLSQGNTHHLHNNKSNKRHISKGYVAYLLHSAGSCRSMHGVAFDLHYLGEANVMIAIKKPNGLVNLLMEVGLDSYTAYTGVVIVHGEHQCTTVVDELSSDGL